MKILGIRTSPTGIRFAILEKKGNKINFLNKNKINALIYPVKTTTESKLACLYDELDKIIIQNDGLKAIILKPHEYYFQGTKIADFREGTYYDSIVLLISGKKEIPCYIKSYANIGTSYKEVKDFAEENVGKTEKDWDTQMADAIAAAYWGFIEHN